MCMEVVGYLIRERRDQTELEREKIILSYRILGQPYSKYDEEVEEGRDFAV